MISTTIFLHGLESSSQGSKGRFFTENFPQVVSPDFSGDLATRLMQLQKLCKNTSDLTLIGSSFGGLMATSYAIEFPENVKKLILLAPALNFEKFQPPPTKLEIPTLLIVGENDDVTPPSLVLPLARDTFSNIEIRLKDDDHMLHQTFARLDWAKLLQI